MFKKTKDTEVNLYSSAAGLFPERSQKIYDDEGAWHNQFRQQVTNRIDENLFKPLYCSNNGTPNASLRVLVGMMVLKEAEGLSDENLFENCRFNMLTRSAIGLLNVDDEFCERNQLIICFGNGLWSMRTRAMRIC